MPLDQLSQSTNEEMGSRRGESGDQSIQRVTGADVEWERITVGWDFVLRSPSQISSKMRQVFEQFWGYFRWVDRRLHLQESEPLQAAHRGFQDLETSKNQLTWFSGWLREVSEQIKSTQEQQMCNDHL